MADIIYLYRRFNDCIYRWADGRKSWALLVQSSRNLARIIWIDTAEREGELQKVDILRKRYAFNLQPNN